MHNVLNVLNLFLSKYWLIFTNIHFVSTPVFSAQFILIFQPDFHLSSSGFVEPLTFILSSGAVRMTEVMLLAYSLESWWWQWQILLQAHRSLQVCDWYSQISLISQANSKKKEQLNQTLCHPQNEKGVQQEPDIWQQSRHLWCFLGFLISNDMETTALYLDRKHGG